MAKKSQHLGTLHEGDIRKILEAAHHDPFDILGAHPVTTKTGPAVAIRIFAPSAETVTIRRAGSTSASIPTVRIHSEGFFEGIVEGETDVFPYRLHFVWKEGGEWETADPYSFLPVMTEEDRYLFNAGDHHRVYEKMGAHARSVNGVEGVHFAVWAPNAKAVSVIGDFNAWDRRRHPMRVLGPSGIWEIFVPGLKAGDLYKFQIKSTDGHYLDKTDPYGQEMEHRPRTASVVAALEGFMWDDREWLERRARHNPHRTPVSVYEVHLGSWMRNVFDGYRWLTYREAAEKLVEYVLDQGFTHIELLPIMEHPFDGSWGYQVTGYFAPTSRFGKPHDLMHLVNLCHKNGIGVILDWVPAHFPKDDHGLGNFDGSHLYEHSDPRKGEHQDWGTLIFNYGRNEVRNFLVSNALFWIDKYHIDGLRIDAVASMLYLDYSRKAGEWVPNQYGGRENIEAIQFVKSVNGLVHHYYPGVLTIAEESTAWPQVTGDLQHGGLGFDVKWNMGWMHDMLIYFSKDPVYRKFHQGNLTFVLLYAFTERFMLPLSHDEVVHGKRSLVSKMPGDEWQQFANLRSLYGLMYAFPGKKLLFMGGEFGQRGEWNHERQLDWEVLQYPVHKGLQKLVGDLNRMYRTQSSLYEQDWSYQGFEWIDFHDADNCVISFVRWSVDRREHLIVVCNFTPLPRNGYRIGVPHEGRYDEILNTDSELYAGSNIGNGGIVWTQSRPSHGHQHSLELTLPPLGVLYLKPR